MITGRLTSSFSCSTSPRCTLPCSATISRRTPRSSRLGTPSSFSRLAQRPFSSPPSYLTQGAFKDIDRKDDVFEFYFFGNPSTSFMPWWVTEAVNFFWLAQLFVVTAFTPPDKPLKLRLELDADSDAESHTEPDRRLL